MSSTPAAGAAMMENLQSDLDARERERVAASEPAPLPPEAPPPAAETKPAAAPVPKIRVYFDPLKPPARLFAALATIQEKDIAAPHDAHNSHKDYDYTSSEGVFFAWKEAIKGSGLSVLACPPRISGPLSAGGPNWMNREIFLTHASGDAIEFKVAWPLNQIKGSTLNDALKSALTESMAWIMRDWALIPKPEREPDPPRRQQPPPQQAPATRPAQSLPAPGAFADANTMGALKDKARRVGITTSGALKDFMRDALKVDVAVVDQITPSEARTVIANLDALIAGAPAGAAPPPAA